MIAVRFYSQAPNPQGIPAEWPAEVRKLVPGESAPEGWSTMTEEELSAHRQKHQAAYDVWKTAREQAHRDAEAATETKDRTELTAMEALRAKIESSENLSAAELQRVVKWLARERLKR